MASFCAGAWDKAKTKPSGTLGNLGSGDGGDVLRRQLHEYYRFRRARLASYFGMILAVAKREEEDRHGGLAMASVIFDDLPDGRGRRRPDLIVGSAPWTDHPTSPAASAREPGHHAGRAVRDEPKVSVRGADPTNARKHHSAMEKATSSNFNGPREEQPQSGG